MEQYKTKNQDKTPLTLLYGKAVCYELDELCDSFFPNVSYHGVEMKGTSACHHSKIGIYVYEDDSLRVVVSTANLYEGDWTRYNQELWISPLCRRLNNENTSGESPTKFKWCLLNYLKHYELMLLNPWIEIVERADFSDIKVFFVTSVPGKHYPGEVGCHAHHVGDLLKRYCTVPPNESWDIVAQSSVIGYYGKSPSEWLYPIFLCNVAKHTRDDTRVNLKLVFPTVGNVLDSYFGNEVCLHYSEEIHQKQQWIHKYLHHWKADKLNRSRAICHSKIYFRVSPCFTKLAWFLVTSANKTRSAWGNTNYNNWRDPSLYVKNYEAGVMFLPHFFDEEYFEIGGKDGNKTFPLLFDLPLKKYEEEDQPWWN